MLTAAGCQNLRTIKSAEYAGARLYDYMDGAAEIYMRHGFQKLRVSEMKRGDRRALVELYHLKTDADAKSLFDQSCDPTSKPLDAGAQGCYWPGREVEGLFHRGPFLCRIFAYAGGEPGETMVRDIARKLDGNIRSNQED